MHLSPEAQIMDSLSPCYRHLFEEIRLKREKMYSGEPVLYACDFTRNSRFNSDGTLDWGFLIFTDKRILEIYTSSKGVMGITYHESGSKWNKLVGGATEDRRWVDPNISYGRSNLSELRLPNYQSFFYFDIRRIYQKDCSISHKSRTIRLMELRFDFYSRNSNFLYIVKAEDGEQISRLLSAIIHNRKQADDMTASFFPN